MATDGAPDTNVYDEWRPELNKRMPSRVNTKRKRIDNKGLQNAIKKRMGNK